MNKTQTNFAGFRPWSSVAICVMLALSGFGLVGCRSRAPRPPAGLVEIERLVPMDSTRSVSLDIWNSAGSVEVIVDPKIAEPQVTARVIEASGARRRAKDLSWVRPSLSKNEAGQALLKVVADPPRVEGVRSQLTIRVPATSGVKVINAEGSVSLRGVTGPIDISNGSIGRIGGEIAVTVRGAQTTPVTILNASGSVSFRAGSGTTGLLDIGTREGEVTIAPGSAQVRGATSTGLNWTGILNDGKNPIQIRTGKGAARVEID